MPPPERSRCVEEDQVDIPSQPSVLESVVENHQIDIGMFPEEALAPDPSIAFGNVRNPWEPAGEKSKLIVPLSSSPITPAEDPGTSPAPEPLPRQRLDNRGLAGAPDRDVPDRDDRNRQAVLTSARVAATIEGETEAVPPLEGEADQTSDR